MTSILYLLSNLEEDEILEINNQVIRNRKPIGRIKNLSLNSIRRIRKLTSNSNRRVRKFILHIKVIVTVSQSAIPTADAIVTPLLPIDIHQLCPAEEIKTRTVKKSPQVAVTISSKVDKVMLTDLDIQKIDIIFNKYFDGYSDLEKTILELRSGALYEWAFLAFVIFIMNLQESHNFQLLPKIDSTTYNTGNYDPRAGNIGSSSKSTTRLEMEKPAFMTQQEYSALPKSEKRQLPDPLGRDAMIDYDGYPKLNLRFYQIEYKTPKHGIAHGLPVQANGKTSKIYAINLRDSLLDMPKKESVKWYTGGQYQGGTSDGREAVNLFDLESNLIAVYIKQNDGSYSFLTTCKLSPIERKHFIATNGNFVTEKMLHELGIYNNYQNTMTSINSVDENSSSDFTPINSFENDVMSITPTDNNSQLNNP